MPDNKKAFLNFAVALTSGWAAQQTRALLYSCNTFRIVFVSGLYGMYRYGKYLFSLLVLVLRYQKFSFSILNIYNVNAMD